MMSIHTYLETVFYDTIFHLWNKSPFQDLDGVAGPQSQLGREAASEKHIDSLKQVPGPPSSSPFQDRGDGETPKQYIDNFPG